MAIIEFTINMNICTSRDDDADVYVGHCPTLGVYSQGETEDDAVEAVKDAVTLHLTTAFDFNRLEKVLRRAGFKKLGAPNSVTDLPTVDNEFVRVSVKKEAKSHKVTLPLRLAYTEQPEYASAG